MFGLIVSGQEDFDGFIILITLEIINTVTELVLSSRVNCLLSNFGGGTDSSFRQTLAKYLYSKLAPS